MWQLSHSIVGGRKRHTTTDRDNDKCVGRAIDGVARGGERSVGGYGGQGGTMSLVAGSHKLMSQVALVHGVSRPALADH